MNRKVYVAGAGAVSSIGLSLDEMLLSFKEEKHGLRKTEFLQTSHQNLFVGEVQKSNEELEDILKVSKHWPRAALLGMFACKMAMSNSGIEKGMDLQIGFVNATTVGGMDHTEEIFPDYARGNKARLREIFNHECGKVTEGIGNELGLQGFSTTINTACSSSANSIIFASRLISQGYLDIAIAGGTDALTRFTLNGFKSLMILDHDLCAPMDASRKGLNLGEGAGYLVLMSPEMTERQKISPMAEIAGYANTNDAFHQTATSPDGRGPFEAMRCAIEMCNLSPQQIDYINLHGTGTINNDLSEATAVSRLFGADVPRMSSTKSFTGHTLGASGGLEAVISVLALQQQSVFPNLRFKMPMPEINLRPQISFEQNCKLSYVLSNSFGFGGNCSALIFKKP